MHILPPTGRQPDITQPAGLGRARQTRSPASAKGPSTGPVAAAQTVTTASPCYESSTPLGHNSSLAHEPATPAAAADAADADAAVADAASQQHATAAATHTGKPVSTVSDTSSTAHIPIITSSGTVATCTTVGPTDTLQDGPAAATATPSDPVTSLFAGHPGAAAAAQVAAPAPSSRPAPLHLPCLLPGEVAEAALYQPLYGHVARYTAATRCLTISLKVRRGLAAIAAICTAFAGMRPSAIQQRARPAA